MIWIFTAAMLLLLVGLVLAAFADRVYAESNRFLGRDEGGALEAWERVVEPRLRLSRESAAASASVLRQVCFGAIALMLALHSDIWTGGLSFRPVALLAFELLLVMILFDRLLPQLLWTRTHGNWLRRAALPIAALFYLVLPVTLGIGLVLSIAGLAEPEADEQERPQREAVDALLEAGEEEGILERSDRELVRSVVEFGDMVVREVMTPRPEIVAVPGSMTLAAFTNFVNEHGVSRVPVYRESLDDVTGIAFARDLLAVGDDVAATRTVASLERPAVFVPEMKKVSELLREMQRQKQHMSLVIDEYGGTAGLVTIEDLLEAIVGDIEDEHDAPEAEDEPIAEGNGTFLVPGSFEAARLPDLLAPETDGIADGAAEEARGSEPAAALLAEPTPETDDERDTDAEDSFVPRSSGANEIEDWLREYDATTVGGLVSEMAGHIPLPGEVVEDGPLRIEVLASTDRLVERVRIARRQQSSSEPE
jgi:putative hemolysin